MNLSRPEEDYSDSIKLFIENTLDSIKGIVLDFYHVRRPLHSCDLLARYLIEHFPDHEITIGRAIAKIGSNSNGLFASFRKRFGLSPHQLLEHTRVLAGILLLTEGLKVKEAAIICGFEDEQNIWNSFRRCIRMPPNALSRKQAFTNNDPMLRITIENEHIHNHLRMLLSRSIERLQKG